MDVNEKDEFLRLSESIWLGGLSLSFAGCVCLFPDISIDIQPMQCHFPCVLAVGGGCQSLSFARYD